VAGEPAPVFERRQLRWLPTFIGVFFFLILLGILPRALVSSELACVSLGAEELCTIDAWLGSRSVHHQFARHELTDVRVEQVSGGRRGPPRCTLHLVVGDEEIPALRRGDCEPLREARSDLRGWLEGGGPASIREQVSPGGEAIGLGATALLALGLGLGLLRSIRVRVGGSPLCLEVSTWTLLGRRAERWEASRVRSIRVDEVTSSDFVGRESTKIQVTARVGDRAVVLGEFVTRMDAHDLATPIEKALGLTR